ncbi:MAG: DUF3857 domain-containing protein [Bacteroidetes bacterium]|nr:DUF3857 domain-containing protein [Bacteroidota bacterium]
MKNTSFFALTSIVVTVMSGITGYGDNLKPLCSSYDWDTQPAIKLSDEDRKELQIIIKDKRTVEYFYSVSNELEEYHLVHKITYVNSSQAIEENNRFYIPINNVIGFEKIKARVINPGGKTIVLDSTDIKETTDEEKKESYRYFAFEGLVPGSFIEYLYIKKKEPLLSGQTIIFQSDVPRKNASFELISPPNLIFAAKGYNGFPEMIPDTTIKDRLKLGTKIFGTPAIKRERMSNYYPNLVHVIFKLNENRSTGKKDIFTYGSAAQDFYNTIYKPLGKDVEKKIAKLVKAMNIENNTEETVKIRTAESWLKTNFIVFEKGGLSYSSLQDILETRLANETGMTRLFTAVLEYLKIPHQVVITSNRFDSRLDPEFDSYGFLENYLLYFPQHDLFTAPALNHYRLGIIPYSWTGNYGLFIKPVTAGSFRTGVSVISFIEPLPFDRSYDNMYVTVHFNDDMANPQFSLKREINCHYAQSYQSIYGFLKEDDRKKLREELVKFINEDIRISEVSVINTESDIQCVKPLELQAKFSSGAFIAKAGNKYIFKIGELIGPQSELYQEEKRKLDVENDFKRSYHREIEFTVPDGMNVTHLENLMMDVYYEENGDRVMAFTSSVSRNGSHIKVIIDEYYKKIIYPVSQFEHFRKVINAAADFNKAVVFFE